MFTRRTARALLPAAVGLLLLASPALLPGDSHVRFVRLSYVEGDVQIDRNAGNGFEKAILNLPVIQGVRLQTGADGRVEVEFENGSTLRLVENSQASFDQLSLQDSGTLLDEVTLDEGIAYVNYLRKGSQEFTLLFAGRRLTLDQSVHFRLSLDNRRAEFAVFSGQLPVSNEREIAWVRKGETLTLDLSGPAKLALVKEITPELTDGWDNQRIRYEAQYNDRASNYNPSSYQYGWSDLSYYGAWSTVPGYGSLWRPFGVGAFWDPFANGAWAFYAGFGYTFISAYPWGWAPYRFGNWVWVGNYGWCWRPGYFNGWQPTPVVVNPPPNWVRPVPPAVPPPPGATIVRSVPVNSFAPGRANPNARIPQVVTQDSIEQIAQPGRNGTISLATGAWVSTSAGGRLVAPAQPLQASSANGRAPRMEGTIVSRPNTGMSPAYGARSYSGSTSGSAMHSIGSATHPAGSMHSSGTHSSGRTK